jgi:hypothetical protein
MGKEFGKFGKIWENLGKFGKIWENLGKWEKIGKNWKKWEKWEKLEKIRKIGKISYFVGEYLYHGIGFYGTRSFQSRRLPNRTENWNRQLSATLAGCVTRGPILTWSLMGLPILKPCISVFKFFFSICNIFYCM